MANEELAELKRKEEEELRKIKQLVLSLLMSQGIQAYEPIDPEIEKEIRGGDGGIR